VPTFKHSCPYCGELVARDAAACPYCATQDPFAPKRCPSCRTPIDDPRWAACPRCGAALGVRPASAASTAPIAAPTAEPAASADARPSCTGCGAAMPSGARFCLACGTLAG
jgi:predicted amidophosphoribosyltransferase